MQSKRKHIKGFHERYTVTKCGKVFSKEKMLKTYFDRGYEKVSLYDLKTKRQKTLGVYRCVALAWIPNPENKSNVCHKDDDKTNNKIENLYWGTAKDNAEDAVRNGKYVNGEDNNTAKLTEEDVFFILSNYKFRDKEYGGTVLAKKFGVNYSCIRKILTRENWKHLTPKKEGE